MLEGQNLVLNQMVYDIIQGRYGGTLSNEFSKQSLSVFICIHGRAGPLVQSVGGACKSRSTPGLRLHITTFSITHGP
jgi:hypothetical protein